jgi:hypothetical protein
LDLLHRKTANRVLGEELSSGLAVLLYAAARAPSIDARTGADTRAIEELRLRVESYQAEQARIPGLTDTMQVMGVGFSVTAIAHLAAGQIAPWIEREAPGLKVYNLTSGFFWVVILEEGMSLALASRLAGEKYLAYAKVASLDPDDPDRHLRDHPRFQALLEEYDTDQPVGGRNFGTSTGTQSPGLSDFEPGGLDVVSPAA